MIEIIVNILGWVGMVGALLGVIIANKFSKKAYNIFAIITGVCLTINAGYIHALPFFVLNFVYTLFGIWGLLTTKGK